MPGTKRKDKKLMGTDVSVYKEDKFLDTLPMYEVKEGSLVTPHQVIATAADEPDYGHDINVWEDSDSEFGKEYKLGGLPFGNPKYHYATQAPFHMGFYYEAGIIYKLAPDFQRTYPEIRIHQFTRLAEFAFSKGHDYWGYRFMGWAMHYLEDLTQPYHSTMTPGISTGSLLWIEFKSVLGFKGAKKEIIERVSDRHTAIEHYQYEFLKELVEKGNFTHPMVKSYQDTTNDPKYPIFDFQYPRNVIALESNQRAEELDERIGKSNYVMAFKEPLVDPKTLTEDQEREKVNEFLNQLMTSFGSHVRGYAKYLYLQAKKLGDKT
ncbi:MAG: phospholipase, partial [Leptospiraceae bacterium]|nr:phospholipase [Leptospiraceae bacterium]